MILTYNIGVCEVRSNYPMVESLVDIASRVGDVTVFTNEYVYNQFNNSFPDGVNFVVKNNNVSLKSYLKLLSDHSKKLDVLFVNTVSGSALDLFAWNRYFRPECFSIMTIHNINRWFNSTLRILPDGYPLSHLLDAHAKNLLRSGILSRFNAFNTIFPVLHPYLRKFTVKPLFSFPFMFHKSSIVKPVSSDRVRVVIPGYVENVRRDYDIVIKAIEGCYNYHDRLEFFLLGKPKGVYGESIINKAKSLNASGFNIHYFDEYIPFDDWKSFMVSADVLLLPIRSVFESVESNEFYGVSKGTGTVSNAVRYGKPFLIPSSQSVGDELFGMIHAYDSVDDIVSFLSKCVVDKSFLKVVKRDALSSAKCFDLGFFQDMLNDFLLGGIGEMN